jgi:phytoene dehydrogenase-like protein
MRENKNYDAIVIGAGVGGITVGTLLAKEGLKVLILEQLDRAGGRALSIQGKEISDNGLDWYKGLLTSQYTYLYGSQPAMADIIKNRMLDGYILDIGYHAISANGAGTMLDFEDQIGGLSEVTKHGAQYGSYYQGRIYRDVAGSNIDPELKKIAKEQHIPYLSFYTDAYGMADEEIDRLEKVSFKTWADQKGISKSDIIFDHLHSVSTLFSTINDPNDISMGDIFRYFKQAFGPKLRRGVLGYPGGFVGQGTMEWSKAVVKKFSGYGGEILFNTRVQEILVQDGKVLGVQALIPGGERVFKAEKVISNIPAQKTFQVIDKQHFPAEWAEKVETMYGYGSYVPYMGLNKLVMPEEESRMGLKNTCVLPRSSGFDSDVYICWNIQSAVDPSVAPEGKYLYTAYLPLTEKESLNRKLVQKLVDRLPVFMEGIYPGFQESIDWKLDLVCWKLEGVAKSISQAGTQKVPVKSGHVEGLYFAGDTAKGYGVAMDCAIASGMICAGEILNKNFGIR